MTAPEPERTRMLTMHDVMQGVRQTYESGRAGRTSPSVVEGMTPREPPAKAGLVQLTPEQLLAVRVERLTFNGKLVGYQRGLITGHARKIAASILDGIEMEPLLLGLDGGFLYVVNGQHRAAAAIIARRPAWAVIRPMTTEERARRFADQRKAASISSDSFVLAGQDPVSAYIRDAIEAEAAGHAHAWAGLIGEKTTASHIGAGSAYAYISSYTLSLIGVAQASLAMQRIPRKEWGNSVDLTHADDLARLFRCFGNKTAAPLVFRPPVLSALTDLAVIAVRRSDKRDDHERWLKHMPRFNFAGHAWITQQAPIRAALTAHWNKRISAGRKIQW